MVIRLFMILASICLINGVWAVDPTDGYRTPPLKTSEINPSIVTLPVQLSSNVTEELPTAPFSKKKKFNFSEKIVSVFQPDTKKKKREDRHVLSSSFQNSSNIAFTPVSSKDLYIHQKIHLPLKNPQKPKAEFRVLRSVYQGSEDNNFNLEENLSSYLEKGEPLNEVSDEEPVILPKKSQLNNCNSIHK